MNKIKIVDICSEDLSI